MNAVRAFIDRRLGRGEGAVTVPILDGPLLPNRALDEAEVVASVAGVDNLVATPKGLLASQGSQLLRLSQNGQASQVLYQETAEIASIAAAKNVLAVGLDGAGILIRGGPRDGKLFATIGDRPLSCPTALAFLDADTLLVALGSQRCLARDWRRDLMEKGATGSLWKLDLETGTGTCIADHLAWPAGVAVTGSTRVYLTESWRHRVLAIDIAKGSREIVWDHLPAYPARISPGVNAGYWLSFYSVRNQLVEFILREDPYRRRMLAEVPEPFWVAPSLSSGNSFKEPMQGSQLKQMGVLKPYSVSRSYGLVAYCDQMMAPRRSYHSRADGAAHGCVSAVELGNDLFVASRGGNKVLRLAGAAAGQ